MIRPDTLIFYHGFTPRSFTLESTNFPHQIGRFYRHPLYRHDYIYTTQAENDLIVLRNHLTLFNAERAQIAAELFLGKIILPIVPDFGQAESARMTLALSSMAFETRQRERESALCTPILNEIKESVSLPLGQKFDDNTESDRPGIPRSPNFVIRATILAYEVCCRGDPRDFSTTLKEMFNSIGKAKTEEQAGFVFDQFDYFKTIMTMFIVLHPGVIAKLPTIRSYLKAMYFRLTDVPELHDLRRILKNVLDKETAEYTPTMELLRKSIRTKLLCSSDPPVFTFETNDDHSPPLQIARTAFQLSFFAAAPTDK